MVLKFKGAEHFRQRLLLSTLSGKAIKIEEIRENDVSPGLRDFEANFLRLIEKVSNGCNVQINETGTTLRYKPGVITGGAYISHNCGLSRSIGYFLEPLVLLSIFGKKPLSCTLQGITNDLVDPGVDVFRTVTLPLLAKCGVEGLELGILKRGAPPEGGGEIKLVVPVVKELQPVNLSDEGMVRRIRGVAYSMKVSPQNTNRMVDGARGILNKLLADVFIFTDAQSGAASGASPGFGIALVAESTSGCMISSECCASRDQEALIVPEDIGKRAACALLEEVRRGGVVDGVHQGIVLLLAAMAPKEINTVRLGALTPYAIKTLRHIKDFLGVTFSLKPENESETIFASCIGAGVKNVSRKVT